VISTAAIPGQEGANPHHGGAVQGMKPGSVIVDLAAETGGNCELTEPGSEIVRNGVSILGPLNLASTVPSTRARCMRRTCPNSWHIVQDGKLRLDFEDQIIRRHLRDARRRGGANHDRFRIDAVRVLLATFIGPVSSGACPALLYTPSCRSRTHLRHRVVGSIVVTGADHPLTIRILGAVALFASMTNIVSAS